LNYSLLSVKVVPGSSRNCISGWLGDTLKVRVTAKPEKGKANEAVLSLLAEALHIDKNRVTISSGNSSARKLVKIHGLAEAEIRDRIDQADA
jgi:uncharacterized protein (TIGR00251 family)